MDNRAFAEIRLSRYEVIALEERFAAWPRNARTASQEPEPGNPAQHRPGYERPPAADRPEPGTDDPHPADGRQVRRRSTFDGPENDRPAEKWDTCGGGPGRGLVVFLWGSAGVGWRREDLIDARQRTAMPRV